MLIDVSDRNLVTGAERFPVDGLPLPPVPFEELGLDAFVLVHDDAVDFAAARTAGMAPLYGLDGVEPAATRPMWVSATGGVDQVVARPSDLALAPGRAPLFGRDEVVWGEHAGLPAARGRDGVDVPRPSPRLGRR